MEYARGPEQLAMAVDAAYAAAALSLLASQMQIRYLPGSPTRIEKRRSPQVMPWSEPPSCEHPAPAEWLSLLPHSVPSGTRRIRSCDGSKF